MLVCFLLLATGIPQAEPSLQALQPQNGQTANIKIKGEGKIVNGKTSLNVDVEINNNPVGGLGIGAQPGPGLGGGAGGNVGPQAPLPPPAQGVGPAGEFTEEEKRALTAHNTVRQTHDAPKMTLNRTMCDEAKAYAEKLAKMGFLKHSSSDDGENLSYGCSSKSAQTVEQAVKGWYDEVCNYDFTGGASSGVTGHFTQVVWKGSTQLGIGRAVTETTESNGIVMKCGFIVGRYKPAGNTGGAYKYNVAKGSFDPSYCNSVKTKKRILIDKSARRVYVSSPFAAVDVPDVENGNSPHAAPQSSILKIQLLNKKKKKNFVSFKRH